MCYCICTYINPKIKTSYSFRFSAPFFWSGFLVIGKDVQVNIKEIRQAMLDQKLDLSEAELEELHGKEFLNPKPVLAPGSLYVVLSCAYFCH